jgi:hypothetical protein
VPIAYAEQVGEIVGQLRIPAVASPAVAETCPSVGGQLVFRMRI